jgi:RNA polymerase sigma-70 factor, ECF subfamily
MPLIDPSQDLALLAAIRKADAHAMAAFATLYERHERALYRFVLLRSGSPDTAADIVQEIFLALLTDQLKFDPSRGALQAFLLGVARNLLLKRGDAARRLVSTATDESDDYASHGFADASFDPQQALLSNETAEAVRRALAALQPHYRDVVILYEMHGMSYVEIAHLCGIDIGTVRSRLSRGRARLAALLAPLRESAASEAAAL